MNLTKLELDTAYLVRNGFTNEQIADRQGVSRWTVRNRLQKMYRKMGLDGKLSPRVDLAVWVVRNRDLFD